MTFSSISDMNPFVMRVVLVHPAGSNWVPGKRDVTVAANRMVPTGLVSIAAYLDREGHDVFLYDCLGPNKPVTTEDKVRELLALKPEILFLDEPTAGMSQEEVPAILEILQKIKDAKDRTMLLVEHKMDMIMSLSDTIMVLQEGRMIADGEPNVYSKYQRSMGARYRN